MKTEIQLPKQHRSDLLISLKSLGRSLTQWRASDDVTISTELLKRSVSYFTAEGREYETKGENKEWKTEDEKGKESYKLKCKQVGGKYE